MAPDAKNRSKGANLPKPTFSRRPAKRSSTPTSTTYARNIEDRDLIESSSAGKWLCLPWFKAVRGVAAAAEMAGVNEDSRPASAPTSPCRYALGGSKLRLNNRPTPR